MVVTKKIKMKKTLFILSAFFFFCETKATIYYLSDTSTTYKLNVQRTAFKEFNCDIINCITEKSNIDNTERIISIKTYGIFESPFFDKIVPESFFRKAVFEQIKSGAFVTRLDLLAKDFKYSGKIIDTLIVLYKDNIYLVKHNTEIVCFLFSKVGQNQSSIKEQYLDIDSLHSKKLYEWVGSGFKQQISKSGDTLKIRFTQLGRDGKTYLYAILKNKGLICFLNLPYYTISKDAIYLKGYLLENAAWDSLRKEVEFEFQLIIEQPSS